MYCINYLLLPIVLVGFLTGLRGAYLISLAASLWLILLKLDLFSTCISLLVFNAAPLITHKFNTLFREYSFQVNQEAESINSSLKQLLNKKEDQDRLNRKMEGEIFQIASLYEITREMSKSLKLKEIFSIFNKGLAKHFAFHDCKLILKDDEALALKREGYLLSSLYVGGEQIGHLAIEGIKDGDLERFYILAGQFALELKRAKLYQVIQELAITDELTGIFVRRHILERFEEELQRSARHKLKLSFLMADIDHFKDYNDRYGHLVGDVILREVASLMKSNIREIDLLGRYGGEEFSVVLPETDKNGGLEVAERIRLSVENQIFKAYDEKLKVTISLGLATFPQDSEDLKDLIDKADKALYQAKQAGRNRACAF